MDLHVAPVGHGHVHPQVPTATLTGAIDTGHIVVVVVLLRGTEIEPKAGVISQVNWSPPSAPPYPEFPNPLAQSTGATALGPGAPEHPWKAQSSVIPQQIWPQPNPHLLHLGSALSCPDKPEASPVTLNVSEHDKGQVQHWGLDGEKRSYSLCLREACPDHKGHIISDLSQEKSEKQLQRGLRCPGEKAANGLGELLV